MQREGKWSVEQTERGCDLHFILPPRRYLYRMKSALIVCNGALPSSELLHLCFDKASLRIAADGGVKAFLRDGLVPDCVIGDLDSQPAGVPSSWNVVRDPDQETNDLEKALHKAAEEKCADVVVLGAVGLRTDQTLKNLSVMQQYAPQFHSLAFKDEQFDIFVIPRQYDSPTVPGKTVSLFPISGKVDGITLTGLRYPLKNEALENGVRDGSSNETTGYELSITYDTGVLIGFFER
jgi:thiamine pyrophosphokinase